MAGGLCEPDIIVHGYVSCVVLLYTVASAVAAAFPSHEAQEPNASR
jgi:hypothetical protein